MMRRLWLMLFVIVALGQGLGAAGTVSWSVTSVGPGLNAYTATVVSTTGGAASGNTTTLTRGTIVQVRIAPGTSGNQPSDLFDVQLQDQGGVDLLAGRGTDLSNAASTLFQELNIWTDSTAPTLDVVLANGGSTKTVTVTVLVKQ